MNEVKKTSWLKRGFALFLTVATLLATTGINPGVFAEAVEGEPVTSGTTVVQVFNSSAPTNGREILRGVTVPLFVTADESYTFSYTIYRNIPGSDVNAVDYKDGATVSGVAQYEATETKKTDVPVTFTSPVQFANGEMYAVQLQIIGPDTECYVGTSSVNCVYIAGARYSNSSIMTLDHETDSTLPTDVSEITLSTTQSLAFDKGTELQLSAETDSDGLRPIKFQSSSPAVATVDNNGKVTGVSAGSAEITASYGSKSATKTVNVVDVKLESNEKTYTGSEITPVLDVSDNMPAISDPSGSGYMASFSSDMVNAGEKNVTVTGYGNFSGYVKNLTFTIAPASIDSANVTNVKTTINSSGVVTDVKDFKIGTKTLEFNRDFTATAVRKSYTSDGAKYDVTYTGTGNYTGTKVKTDVESKYDSSNTSDITERLEVELKNASYGYTGAQIKPSWGALTVKLDGTDIANPGANQTLQRMVAIDWGENTNVGEGWVRLSGKTENGFSGEIKKTFNISKRNISDNFDFDNSSNDTGKIRIQIANDTITSPASGEYMLSKAYVHTGNEIKPEISLIEMISSYDAVNQSVSTYPLTRSDYSVEYANCKRVSARNSLATIAITGQGNFTGEIVIQFEIVGDFEKELSVVLNGREYGPDGTGIYRTAYAATYTGNEIKPVPELVLNTKTLPASDYELSYSENINAGENTAIITATGKNKYAGKTVEISYSINKKSIAGGEVTLATDTYTYSGKEIKPKDSDITVKVDGKTLTIRDDYTVECTDCENAGTAKLTVKAAGNYTGELRKNYTIESLNLATAKTNGNLTMEYTETWAVTGEKIEPPVTLKYNNGVSTVTLSADDYNVTYTNNVKTADKNATKAPTITVKAKTKLIGTPNLTGEISGTFTIKNQEFGDIEILLEGNPSRRVSDSGVSPVVFESTYEATYRAGQKIIPNLVINKDGAPLRNLTDYSYTVDSDAKKAGTGTINIIGAGNYSGSLAKVTFKINKRDITDSVISVVTDGVDGTSKPKVTIKDTTLGAGREKTLEEGADKDYVLDPVGSDTWPTTAGKHTAKVTCSNASGNYTGTREIEYEIGKDILNAGLKIKLVNPKHSDNVYCEYDTAGDKPTGVKVPYLGAGTDDKPRVIAYTADDVLVSADDYSVTYSAASGTDIHNAGSKVNIQITAGDGSANYYSTSGSPLTFSYEVIPVEFSTNTLFANTTDLGAATDNYFEKTAVTTKTWKQGVVVVDNSVDTNEAKNASNDYHYYFAHQSALPVVPKLFYYPYGKEDENGVQQTPIELTAGVSGDYMVSPATLNAEGAIGSGQTFGTKLVTFSGNGKNYKGSRNDVQFVFDQVDLEIAKTNSKAEITIPELDADGKIDYTGDALTLSPVVEAYGATLTEGTDYTVLFKKGATVINASDIRDAGIYTVSVTGKTPNYTGTITKNFEVSKITFESIVKTPVMADITYTGSELANVPPVLTRKTGAALTPTQDYNVKIYKGDYKTEIVSGTKPSLDAAPEVNGTTVQIKDIGYYTAVYTSTSENYPGDVRVRFTVYGDLSDKTVFGLTDALKNAFDTGYELNSSSDNTTFRNDVRGLQLKNLKDPGKNPTSADYTVTDLTSVSFRPGTITIDVDGRAPFFRNSQSYDVLLRGNANEWTVEDLSTNKKGDSGIYDYTGNKPNLNLRVSAGGNVLTKGRDYEIAPLVENDAKAGRHTYTVNGIGAYSGSKSGYFYVYYNLNEIEAKDVIVNSARITEYNATYTGAQIKPAIDRIEFSGGSISNDAYEVSEYGENIEPGTGTLKITPKGTGDNIKAYGEKTIEFKIAAITLNADNSRIVVKEEDTDNYQANPTLVDYDYQYGGSGIRPPFKLQYRAKNTDPWSELSPDVDYGYEYSNNVDAGAGTATIKVTAKGRYQGTLTAKFTINQIDISALNKDNNYASGNLKANITNPTYAGYGAHVAPGVELLLGGQVLSEGTDYEITNSHVDGFDDYSKYPTGRATVTGKGNFKGSFDVIYDVEPAEISQISVVDKTYNGQVQKPEFVVQSNLGELPTRLTEGADKDYIVSEASGVQEPKNAGVYGYNITPNTNRFRSSSGSVIQIEYKINPIDLASDIVTASFRRDLTDAVSYTPSKNDIELKASLASGVENVPDAEYTIANPETVTTTGEGSIVVRGTNDASFGGTGNYMGERSIKYYIGKNIGTLGNIKIIVKGYDYLGKVVDGGLTEAGQGDSNALPSFIYDGQDCTPEFAVKNNESTLRAGRDYEIMPYSSVDASEALGDDFVNVGLKRITIKGKGEYYGTKTADYFVVPRDGSRDNFDIQLDNAQQDANGYYIVYNQGTLDPVVKHVYNLTLDPERSHDLLFEGDCDAVGYSDNHTDITDNAYVKLKLKHNYKSDEIRGKYRIVPISLDDCDISLGLATLSNGIEVGDDGVIYDEDGTTLRYNYSYEYQPGKAIKPEIVIKYRATQETIGRYKPGDDNSDFVVEYVNATNPGEATVKVTARTKADGGSGNLSSTEPKEVKYAIVADFSKTNVVTVGELDPQFYDGTSDAMPALDVRCGDKSLTLDQDYEIVDVNFGDATCTYKLKGKAPFYKNTSETFSFDLSKDSDLLEVRTADFEYTGQEIIPTFELVRGDTVIKTVQAIKENTHRVQSGSDRHDRDNLTDVGTFETDLEINIAGSISHRTVTYRIVPCDINHTNITLIKNYIYDAEDQEVNPYIRDTRSSVAKTVLEKDTDYSVNIYKGKFTTLESITGSPLGQVVYPGDYTVVIAGKGNYAGSKLQTITVDPDGMHKLHVDSTSSTQVVLGWTRSHDVTGYKVENMTTGVVYGNTTSNTYTAKSLTSGVNYTFRVTPYVVTAGVTRYGKSADVQARTNPGTATGTTTKPSANGTVDLTWSTSANVDGYEIYRCPTQNGTYQLAAVVPLREGHFVDKNVASGATYYYKLRGYIVDPKTKNNVSYGAYSSAIRATTH